MKTKEKIQTNKIQSNKVFFFPSNDFTMTPSNKCLSEQLISHAHPWAGHMCLVPPPTCLRLPLFYIFLNVFYGSRYFCVNTIPILLFRHETIKIAAFCLIDENLQENSTATGNQLRRHAGAQPTSSASCRQFARILTDKVRVLGG